MSPGFAGAFLLQNYATVKHMIIEVYEATKRFGGMPAVDAASFRIKKGEIVGFVGANGAGKSTTINMLLGFIAPSSGELKLFGELVQPHRAHRQHRRIGFASGDMELPLHLSGRQYLTFLSKQYGGVSQTRYAKLMKTFEPALDKKMATLSRGNKQKIALMAAFLPRPDVLIFDEPTSGLDPLMQEAFLDLLRAEQARGATVFMSSHYLSEVADVCSRVILMRNGQIVRDIGARELFAASGKTVRIVSGYTKQQAPRDVETVERTVQGDEVELVFNYKGDAAKLQRWLGGVRSLRDIEITEFDLEAAFAGLYDPAGSDGGAS